MQIQFKQSIATERGSYTTGQRVTVRALPKEWQRWLTEGVIQILPDDNTERAVAPALPERTVVPAAITTERPARRKTVAGENDGLSGDGAEPDSLGRGTGARPRARRRGQRRIQAGAVE